MTPAYHRMIADRTREAVAITENPSSTRSQIALAYRVLRTHGPDLVNAPFSPAREGAHQSGPTENPLRAAS